MLHSSTFTDLNSQPVSEKYDQEMKEKRRILIQEDEDSDTDVIFWDEHTRPEDIMEGKDLEDFYRSQRHFFMQDDSSDCESQKKHFEEASRKLHINPDDIPGYKTFFQEGTNIEDESSDTLNQDFHYFDSLLEAHPEIKTDFFTWQHHIDKTLSMDVKNMTDEEFQEIVQCPESILKVVDAKHKPLFQINRKDFMNIQKTSSPSPMEPVRVWNEYHCRRQKETSNLLRQVLLV